MFSLNNELQYIEAAESDVVSVHRSLAGVVIAPENHKQQMCDAFLCVILENGEGERVYAALYLGVSKETLVYTPSLPPVAASESIRDALCFLEAMGFRMEICNLGGSVPLREVILRTIKVLRPPGAWKMGSSHEPAAQAPSETLRSKGERTITALPDSGGSGAETAAAVRAERDWLIEEQAKTSRVFATELAKLQAELERAGAEKRALAKATSTSIAALEFDLAAANSELALLQAEYKAIRNEYMLVNGELADRNADLQQLRGEKTARHPGAAAQPAAPGNDPGPVSTAPVSFARAKIEVSPRGHQADFGGNEAPAFHLDNSLSAVPCGSPDEVVDLRVSFNTIRIICADGKAQSCSAYICGLARNGSREIYVALYQTENKKALVYVPARQPSDAADYERVLYDAISFADEIGFLINLAFLGGGAAQRAKVLREIPVLRCP